MQRPRVKVSRVTYGQESPENVALATVEVVLRALNLDPRKCSTKFEPDRDQEGRTPRSECGGP